MTELQPIQLDIAWRRGVRIVGRNVPVSTL